MLRTSVDSKVWGVNLERFRNWWLFTKSKFYCTTSKDRQLLSSSMSFQFDVDSTSPGMNTMKIACGP